MTPLTDAELDGLCKRLDGFQPKNSITREAASAIRSLRTERDALKVERDAKWGGVELLAQQRNEAIAERDALRTLLSELTALVRGECPSLLNEDSGGDAMLSIRIDSAMQGGQQ